MQMVGLGCVGVMAVLASDILYPNPPGASGLLLAVVFIGAAVAGAEVLHRLAAKVNQQSVRWFNG
jgi:hypothetical protein